ncbi:MAG: PASTA domain-containing protein [Clostridia bacterium]|nr:PASTA domain-containing protein [Clostridia bacterium]MBR7034045.1 PASTA domain-containing protein [Clostridia bacterium]
MNAEQNRTDRKTYHRLVIAFCLFAVAAAIIIGRLALYQIRDHDYYQDQVLDQITVSADVNPERGDILDTNGNPLATNKTVYNVIISPSDINEAQKEIDKKNSDNDPKNDVYYDWTSPDGASSYRGTSQKDLICSYLSYQLGVEYSTVAEKAAKTDRMYELIGRDVEENVNEKIRAFIDKFGLTNQIYDRASSKRFYPYGDLACHVIGFTNSDGVGIYGLEKYYNNLLEGTSGKYILAQDARKNDMPFEYEAYIETENGENLEITLDRYIQTELQNQLEATWNDSGAGNRVTGIVMNVETGGILAMATYPSFDLNEPFDLDDTSKEALSESGFGEGTEEYTNKRLELLYAMWGNKAITETYEPGSTFKIITTAAALEEKVVTFDTPFTCTGSLTIPNYPRPISCHDTSGHGTLAFRYGLQQSCNPTLMQVAALLGEDKFYDYFEAFGYTGKTGIDLPAEVGGIYSSRSDFNNVSLAVYSFGQTFKTTPIQQLTAVSTVANGGYYVTPHLFKAIVDDDGKVIKNFETDVKRQVVSTEVCREISDVLEDGVSGDGGAKNAYVKGYKIAAKTGTSEKRDKFDENGEKSFRVSSCVGYAPSDDPKISAIIIVDEPMKGFVGGGTNAAPYIARLFSSVLPYVGVEKQYTDADLAAMEITVSGYVGMNPSDAKDDLIWKGIRFEIIGNGDVVTAQVPAEGSVMNSENGSVLLYCGDAAPSPTIEVPDLIGKGADVANSMVINSGLNIRFTGAPSGQGALVFSQSPEAGTMAVPGQVVEIELRYDNITD